MFPRIDYLEWTSGRPDGASYDFGSSDIHATPSTGLIDWLHGLPRPSADVSLESLIAAQYDGTVAEENVLVTAGATMANACAAGMAISEKRNSSTRTPVVVTESPGYEPLSETPRALGADVRHFRRPLEQEYRVSPRNVAPLLDEDVRLVTLSNRHNPSGKVLSRETLSAVADEVGSYDATLLVDEVYAPFGTETRRGAGTAFGGPTMAGYESTLVSNSLTKFFGFDDLRIGWLIGDPEAIRGAWAVQRHLLDVSETSRELARIALHNVDDLEERSREMVRTNASLLSEFVTDRNDLTGYLPRGHTMAFLEFEGAGGDKLVAAATEEDLLLVPGRFFGEPSRFRISLGKSPAEMEEGLRALRTVLDGLS